jgi:hypothetical protein
MALILFVGPFIAALLAVIVSRRKSPRHAILPAAILGFADGVLLYVLFVLSEGQLDQGPLAWLVFAGIAAIYGLVGSALFIFLAWAVYISVRPPVAR